MNIKTWSRSCEYFRQHATVLVITAIQIVNTMEYNGDTIFDRLRQTTVYNKVFNNHIKWMNLYRTVTYTTLVLYYSSATVLSIN